MEEALAMECRIRSFVSQGLIEIQLQEMIWFYIPIKQ